MKKLKMHSTEQSKNNIIKIGKLFPECMTEIHDETTGRLQPKVDFDQLRQVLSDHIVDGPEERYRLDWPGKRDAMAQANKSINKTLRPDKKESKNFDKTKNLFVEGDNLDALKLIQETYLGKIKMIYIDPTYNNPKNKEKNFLYKDDYSESRIKYFEKSNQVTEGGGEN